MSASEVERFAKDLKLNPALLKGVESGARLGLAEAVKIGAEHGYGFSLEDVKTFIQERARASGRELTEGQLDQVAGGAGDGCLACATDRTGRG